jgi:hypothetical protein
MLLLLLRLPAWFGGFEMARRAGVVRENGVSCGGAKSSEGKGRSVGQVFGQSTVGVGEKLAVDGEGIVEGDSWAVEWQREGKLFFSFCSRWRPGSASLSVGFGCHATAGAILGLGCSSNSAAELLAYETRR